MSLQTDLDAARLAYNDLVLGNKIRVFVDQNGERYEYTTSTKGTLYAYILQLQAQLDAGGTGLVLSVPKPLNFLF